MQKLLSVVLKCMRRIEELKMKNYDWQSSVIIILFCFGICVGLKLLTDYTDKIQKKTYVSKMKKNKG